MEIQGFPEYLIYPDGRVYSKERNGWKGGFIKHEVMKDGYLRRRLIKDTKPYRFQVHRIVAQHYIPNPDNKPHVDHKDRNRQNNDVSNLRWVTCCENHHNKGKISTNTSGYKNISYMDKKKLWKYNKVFNIRKPNFIQIQKYFKLKRDCLCYKYIMILRIKARHFH